MIHTVKIKQGPHTIQEKEVGELTVIEEAIEFIDIGDELFSDGVSGTNGYNWRGYTFETEESFVVDTLYGAYDGDSSDTWYVGLYDVNPEDGVELTVDITEAADSDEYTIEKIWADEIPEPSENGDLVPVTIGEGLTLDSGVYLLAMGQGEGQGSSSFGNFWVVEELYSDKIPDEHNLITDWGPSSEDDGNIEGDAWRWDNEGDTDYITEDGDGELALDTNTEYRPRIGMGHSETIED